MDNYVSTNDLGIKVWFEENVLNVEMPMPIYNDLNTIFAKDGMSIEEAINEFMKWSIDNPEEFRKWIETKKD